MQAYISIRSLCNCHVALILICMTIGRSAKLCKINQYFYWYDTKELFTPFAVCKLPVVKLKVESYCEPFGIIISSAVSLLCSGVFLLQPAFHNYLHRLSSLRTFKLIGLRSRPAMLDLLRIAFRFVSRIKTMIYIVDS